MSSRIAALRSGRAVVAISCLLLIVLPLLFLAGSYVYEAAVVWNIRRDLDGLAQKANAPSATDQALALPALNELGRSGRVLIRRLDREGGVLLQTDTGRLAIDASLLGLIAEGILNGLWTPSMVRDLAEIDRDFGPLAARPEVRQALSGQRTFAVRETPSNKVVVVQLAVPLASGGALYLERGSRRGLRQLFLVRHELLKLVLYQSVFALLLGIFLSRHLLHPLQRMARAARRYPKEPLGDARLLSRPDELGELARAIAALTEDLEKRRRTTADLGADVAHEFKNPLATITASVELLSSRTDGVSPERIQMVADHIQEAVTRLRRSLDALLSLLRLEATLNDEPREPVAYAELLDDILADYRRDPRYADFTLRVDCAADLEHVHIVPHRWEEMLRNVLDNALVQPMTQREVQIQARRDGDTVITTVRDFGPGVSVGNRSKIFRRFFSQRPDGAPPGTGLGLSIVQAVVTAHGGQVEVRDPETGPGAVFVMTLHQYLPSTNSPAPAEDA